jgi:hypothetical protein
MVEYSNIPSTIYIDTKQELYGTTLRSGSHSRYSRRVASNIHPVKRVRSEVLSSCGRQRQSSRGGRQTRFR